MKNYIDKKDIKVNKVYDVEYLWRDKWEKAWGRLTTVDQGCGMVNIITMDGGVSNVEPDRVRFIKLTGVVQSGNVIIGLIKKRLGDLEVISTYVLPKRLFIRGDIMIRVVGHNYVEMIQCGHSFDLTYDFLSDSVLQQILDSIS